MTTKREKWQQLVRCKLCLDEIYSKRYGEYTTCKCGACSVDQTPYYARWIGELEQMELVETDGQQ